jgi:hypothetical protein
MNASHIMEQRFAMLAAISLSSDCSLEMDLLYNVTSLDPDSKSDASEDSCDGCSCRLSSTPPHHFRWDLPHCALDDSWSLSSIYHI